MCENNLPKRTCGFRFFITDGIFIITGILLTFFLWPEINQFALIIPFTIFHFFLFCNIFRIRRSFELIWTFIFLFNFFYHFLNGFLWNKIIYIQIPLTIILIFLEIKSTRYHGIFCHKLNSKYINAYLNWEIK